jgi:hypothetical protein
VIRWVLTLECPAASYQIGIFDLNPQEAHALITSGRVRRIP